jgi:uncharacterized protein DUF4373
MAKEALYFSHDLNARHDKKIGALVKDYKAAGYGVFWAAVEMMHEEGGVLELDDVTYAALAKDLNEKMEFIKSIIVKCINTYKLFFMIEEKLKSNRVDKNITKRKSISKVRSDAAFAKHLQTNGEQLDTLVMQKGAKKERKKEIKEIERGVKFSDDGLNVFFEDGSSQELGQRQQQQFREGGYQPHYLKKGLIE